MQRDLDLLQLPDCVTKKLNSLKSFELLNKNHDFEKGDFKSRTEKLKETFMDLDKENIHLNESQTAL